MLAQRGTNVIFPQWYETHVGATAGPVLYPEIWFSINFQLSKWLKEREKLIPPLFVICLEQFIPSTSLIAFTVNATELILIKRT